MTAFVVFSESEPLIVVMAQRAVAEGSLPDHLANAGIDRFIAYEIDPDALRHTYGTPFDVVESDIRRGRDFRVLDANGAHVFERVNFADFGDRFVVDH